MWESDLSDKVMPRYVSGRYLVCLYSEAAITGLVLKIAKSNEIIKLL